MTKKYDNEIEKFWNRKKNTYRRTGPKYCSGTECCIKIKYVAMANIWCFIFDLCTPEKFNQEILNPKGLFLQYNSLYPIMYQQNAVYKNCFAGLGMRDFLYQRNLATGNSKTNLTNGLCREASRTQGRTMWRNCRLVIYVIYR